MAFVHVVIDHWRYIQLLQQYLLPYFDNSPLNTLAQTIYQDDNARPHRAVQNFCIQNGIRRPIWPAYSPDLNSIENVWAKNKKFVSARHPRHPRLQNLRRLIVIAWKRIITPDFCRRLYDGLSGRIRCTIGKRGRR